MYTQSIRHCCLQAGRWDSTRTAESTTLITTPGSKYNHNKDKWYRGERWNIYPCTKTNVSDLRHGSDHSPCLPVGRCGGIWEGEGKGGGLMVSGGNMRYIPLYKDQRIYCGSDLRHGSGHSPCLPVGRCGGIPGVVSTTSTIIPGIIISLRVKIGSKKCHGKFAN